MELLTTYEADAGTCVINGIGINNGVGDDTGETYYYDLYEDALEYCNELNED